jgi:hypothetical protein
MKVSLTRLTDGKANHQKFPDKWIRTSSLFGLDVADVMRLPQRRQCIGQKSLGPSSDLRSWIQNDSAGVRGPHATVPLRGQRNTEKTICSFMLPFI